MPTAEPTGFTPKELGELVAQLPELSEVAVILNCGMKVGVLHTGNTLEAASQTGSPEHLRWARNAVLGIQDALRMGSREPSGT